MEKYLRFTWLFATITSWYSFGAASWHWAEEDFNNPGMRTLTVLWFVISLILFGVGVLTRKSSG